MSSESPSALAKRINALLDDGDKYEALRLVYNPEPFKEQTHG
jgi:hypothetical protein